MNSKLEDSYQESSIFEKSSLAQLTMQRNQVLGFPDRNPSKASGRMQTKIQESASKKGQKKRQKGSDATNATAHENATGDEGIL
jgi:hypothetical protein